MNKINILNIVALVLVSFNLAVQAIPVNLIVYDIGPKRLIGIGDSHTKATDKVTLEPPYLKVIEKYVNAVALHMKKTCILVENMDPIKAKNYANSPSSKDSLSFLSFLAYQNNCKLGQLDFQGCSLTESNTALHAIINFLGIVRGRPKSSMSKELLDNIGSVFKNHDHFKNLDRLTFKDFFEEADQIMVKNRLLIEQSSFSIQAKNFLMFLQNAAARELANCRQEIEYYNKLIPNFSTLPCLDAIYALFSSPCSPALALSSSEEEQKFPAIIFQAWFLPFIARIGDLKIIFQSFDLLKNYDAVILNVGSSHINILKEFLRLNAKSIERVAEGDFTFEGDFNNPLPSKRYKALAQEWISKNHLADPSEAKAGGEAANAAALLRPAVPMSAALVGEPISEAAAAAPSAVERKEMAESREVAAAAATAGKASSESISKICPACGKSGNRRCSRCKKVYYCSTECQAAHWPTHKPTCTAAK